MADTDTNPEPQTPPTPAPTPAPPAPPANPPTPPTPPTPTPPSNDPPSWVNDLRTTLDGLPEKIVHAYREATQPPEPPKPKTPETPAPTTQTPGAPANTKGPNKFARWWFGAA